MDDLDRSAASDFTRRYLLALGLVALLTLAAQAVVQVALHRSRSDAEVVNLAGRQRMLSQRLTMSALAWRHGDPDQAGLRLATLRQVLAEWSMAHRRLESGGDLPNAGADNSPAVHAAFTTIDPFVARMVAAAEAIPERPSAVDELLAAEGGFLGGMERIVATYRDEAAARVQRLIALELGLCALLIVILTLEAVLVFRPAVRRLRQAIADRERLREQEFHNRELQIAADTARGIGQDLHDGLGQTLTALSFQAKTVERTAPGNGAQALVAGISDAIAQCRAQARRLAPVEIQVAGLEAALRELADATASAAGIACTLDWQASGPPASGGEDIFRVVQEAVTNALRHGRAQRITITAGPRLVSIVDDGQSDQSAPTPGVGMRSMAARAMRLGARLATGPRREGGWTVAMTWDSP